MANENLIIRLPNWIGDTLMTYPMLLLLQKSKIDFVCIGQPWVSDLFSGTEIKIVPDSMCKSIRWCYRYYIKNKFNYGLLCTSSLSTAIPMKMAGIHSVGYGHLTSEKVSYDAKKHTVENYFRLGQVFVKNKLSLNDVYESIPLSSEAIAKAEQIIKDYLLEKYIVICPYATNLHKGRNKEWPYWKDFLTKYNEKEIVALVAKNDKQRCKDDFPGIKIISEKLSVTAQIMRKAQMVITNDSGPMHLATFFGAHVIGLLGATDLEKTKPWNGEFIVGKNGGFASVDEVIEKIS